MITDFNQIDLNKSYTYADYLTWQFDEMVEIIKGKVFRMSPAPSSIHQEVATKLIIELGICLKHKNQCRIFSAPFDVRLTNKEGKESVVQPDLCIVCDSTKIVERGCEGAPDLIVEVLSPSTAAKDLNEKYELYQENQVKEYWIVHPAEQSVLIYQLNDSNGYTPSRLYSNQESISSKVFPEITLNLGEIFS